VYFRRDLKTLAQRMALDFLTQDRYIDKLHPSVRLYDFLQDNLQLKLFTKFATHHKLEALGRSQNF